MRSVVIHAHFYQPPREHPYFDEIEAEASAAPYHDWNARIDRECYRAVVAARVAGAHGRIARITNTLEQLSFNVGPTLLTWMEQHSTDAYRAMLAADRESCRRLDGHGNAIAHPYHHVILPLASRRDKVTEVRWGIADFTRRFGREPEGFWLPETAVDDETLDVLAQEGIRFTILAPYQVQRRAPNGLPGRYTTNNGRTIALCTYHGDLSHGIAFGGLVRDADHWARELLSLPPDVATARDDDDTTSGLTLPHLVSMATDGETYGHHHKFAEMALARVFDVTAHYGARVENFASFLARHPATFDVEIVAPTAWSCAHGVERWRSNCGCRSDTSRNPSQEWRTPLRNGLNALAEALHAIFERDGAPLLGDVWAARDAYGRAVSQDADARYQFSAAQLPSTATPDEKRRVAELLEMERDAMRMFTSCAWFFDDIGGLEPLQVFRYAAWAVGLAGADGPAMEAALLEELGHAESNVRTLGTGREIYLAKARPYLPPHVRVAAGLVAARLIAPKAATSRAWRIDGPDHAVTLTHRRTGRQYQLTVEVEVSTLDLLARVTAPELDTPALLVLDELPERQRSAIHGELRTETLDRLLDRAELAALERGAIGPILLSEAVLPEDFEPGRDLRLLDRQAVMDLLRVLEGLGQSVPFDAQTAFFHVWKSAPTDDLELVGLARRMGFDTTAAG